MNLLSPSRITMPEHAWWEWNILQLWHERNLWQCFAINRHRNFQTHFTTHHLMNKANLWVCVLRNPLCIISNIWRISSKIRFPERYGATKNRKRTVNAIWSVCEISKQNKYFSSYEKKYGFFPRYEASASCLVSFRFSLEFVCEWKSRKGRARAEKKIMHTNDRCLMIFT